MKVKCDHRSKFSNSSNWIEAWKKKPGLQRDSNPWPPRIPVRCSINWAMKPHIESKVNFDLDLAPNVWLHSSVGRASHRYSRRSWVRIPLKPWFFFRLLSNCLNWKIYCDDHTLLSPTTAVQIWIISLYISHSETLIWIIKDEGENRIKTHIQTM